MMTKRKVLQILRKARKLLAKGWTQRTFAKDKDGVPVTWDSQQAVCFCLGGALRRASQDAGKPYGWESACELRRALGITDAVAEWNDAETRKQRHVLARLDRAIAKLEGKS